MVGRVAGVEDLEKVGWLVEVDLGWLVDVDFEVGTLAPAMAAMLVGSTGSWRHMEWILGLRKLTVY